MSDTAMTEQELEAIRADISNCATYNFGMRAADRLAHEGAPALLDEVFRLRALVGEPEYLTSAPSDTAAQIVAAIRARCTPPHEAYTKGGDVLIAAVADWIENPPEWVKAPWLSPAPSDDDREARRTRFLRAVSVVSPVSPPEGAHWECNCVPDQGPSHCHACGDMAGRPVPWAEAVHGPVSPPEDVAKLIEPIIREFAEAVEDFESIADSDQAPEVANMIAAELAQHSAASSLVQEAAERAIIHTDMASVTLSVDDAQAHRATANLLHRLGAALAALRAPVPVETRTPAQVHVAMQAGETVNLADLVPPRVVETVTTVEELDALPVGTVIVSFDPGEPESPSIACRAALGWQFLGGDPDRRYHSAALLPSTWPIYVVHHPTREEGQ